LSSSSEFSSSFQVPATDLPKMIPSRAPPPASLSAAQSVGCDDRGFTLATQRKKKKDIPETATRAASTPTSHVAPSFTDDALTSQRKYNHNLPVEW
jgi:hypothetical protein